VSTQYTNKLKLGYWQLNDQNWHLPFEADIVLLDGMAALTALCVTIHEDGGATSLNVDIAAGTYLKQDGTLGTVSATSKLLAASTTKVIYVDDTGTVQVATSYPSTPCIPLATVTTGSAAVTAIVDNRVAYLMTQAGPKSGTVTLVAGVGTVSAPWVTTSTPIVQSRLALGGTLGNLSVTITGGTGFTIGSSSSTETSTVAWAAFLP
jgi:hypothetical protein